MARKAQKFAESAGLTTDVKSITLGEYYCIVIRVIPKLVIAQIFTVSDTQKKAFASDPFLRYIFDTPVCTIILARSGQKFIISDSG